VLAGRNKPGAPWTRTREGTKKTTMKEKRGTKRSAERRPTLRPAYGLPQVGRPVKILKPGYFREGTKVVGSRPDIARGSFQERRVPVNRGGWLEHWADWAYLHGGGADGAAIRNRRHYEGACSGKGVARGRLGPPGACPPSPSSILHARDLSGGPCTRKTSVTFSASILHTELLLAAGGFGPSVPKIRGG